MVYNRSADWNILAFLITFLYCRRRRSSVSNLVLRKNQEFLFKRNDKHWWLTGFILGEFSEPCELTWGSTTLKDKLMLDAFVDALMQKDIATAI